LDCPAHPPAPPALRLDDALKLLRQAGIPEPTAAAGSADYLQALVDALVDLSSRDPLTALANRRSFELALSREIDRVARSGEPALLLVLDIDHFKRVNDSHGHNAGDRVIEAVARALVDCVRPMDLVARIGGEEFAAVIIGLPPSAVARLADRICSVVRDTPIEHRGQTIRTTVSLGVAFRQAGADVDSVLKAADNAVYEAKHHGRDRWAFASPHAIPVGDDYHSVVRTARHQLREA